LSHRTDISTDSVKVFELHVTSYTSPAKSLESVNSGEELEKVVF